MKLADTTNRLDLSMAEWRKLTGHEDDGGIPNTDVRIIAPQTGKATLVLRYRNVIDGKFVEDEARQVVTAVVPPLLPDYNRDGSVDANDVLVQKGGLK